VTDCLDEAAGSCCVLCGFSSDPEREVRAEAGSLIWPGFGSNEAEEAYLGSIFPVSRLRPSLGVNAMFWIL